MVHLGIESVLQGTPSAICKTKVVCTLGPKSRSVEVLEELLRAGLSVARFNFSHGSHEYHQVSGLARLCLGARPARLLAPKCGS